jgi:hypothetical protein
MSHKTIVILLGNGEADKPALITPELRSRLLANGSAKQETDHVPVVKLFFPCSAATWLITEMMPDNPDILFGLCDLGMGFPELGYVSLSELEAVRGPLGLGIERDAGFEPKHPLSVYADAARLHGVIVEDEAALAKATAGSTEGHCLDR